MEKSEFVKKIEKEASDAGVNSNRLMDAMVVNSLPKSGKFIGYTLEQPLIDGKKRPYLALVCESGEKCSLNTIQAVVHTGSKEDVVLKKVEKEGEFKGKFVISGQSLNPHLSGNQAEIIERLMNKSFEVELKQAYVIPFNKVCKDEAKTREALVTKTYYKVTIK